ncbi:hypothetical protein GCM10027451_16780 [Geodermatophilus aquaeductus]|uniref:Membrane protein n=1 Tax=Geodermatophilus aquaeductus TaxID=1564161 RepID=A0A521E0W9_9ACTN|nr:membrane protein [Geodermatophilus aquaeductus]
MLLAAALAPADRRDLVSSGLIRRFRLTDDAADAVSTLFAHPAGSAVGLLSGFLLVFSGVSLTRRMQRMYLQAWGLTRPPGIGHAVHAVLGLTALLLGIGLTYSARALVASLPRAGILAVVLSAGAGFLLWTCLPWLLLDRRVAWRRLVPTGALTAVGTTLYGIVSTVYMPRLLETYSDRYGLFGVTLALVGWLLAVAVIVVVATTVAAEFDRAPDPWARRTRRRLRIGPAVDDPAGAGPTPTRGADDSPVVGRSEPAAGASRMRPEAPG